MNLLPHIKNIKKKQINNIITFYVFVIYQRKKNHDIIYWQSQNR